MTREAAAAPAAVASGVGWAREIGHTRGRCLSLRMPARFPVDRAGLPATRVTRSRGADARAGRSGVPEARAADAPTAGPPPAGPPVPARLTRAAQPREG